MTLQPQSISSALKYLTYASQMLSVFSVPPYLLLIVQFPCE